MFNIAPVFAVWIAWFATAANLVISKVAVPYVTSALFILLACITAALCFTPYLIKTGEWKLLLGRKVWPQCLAMGTFGTALPMTIFMIALNYTTPVNGSILNQFEIIYSLILSAILLKERPTMGQIGGSLLILLGVGLLLWQAGTTVQLKGDLMIIGCLWMFQLSHIFAKKLPAHMPPQLIAAARALFAIPALAVLVACLAIFQGPLQFESNATLWSMLVLCAVVNYFLGNTFWYQAIRHMDLSKATAIILSYPVMTFVLSVLLGQDKITAYKILGMILAIGGAYIVTGMVKQGERRKEMKKLVLFDLDGTLVNAGGAGRTALKKAMEELYGVNPEFDHSLISGRTDLDNFSIVYSLIKKGKKPTAAEMKKMKAKYLEILPVEVHASVRCKKYDLIAGVEKFLKLLAKDKDVILGLGTGNLEEGAKIKLEPSKLGEYFTVGGYGEDGHTREEMLQAAVKRAEKKFKTKIEPENVYVIGDTHRDVCAAKNCGFHSAVLTNGFGDAQKIQRAAAELETKDFTDLTTFCVWLGLKTDPKGVKRGSYIMPASAIEHVFFSRTGIDEDRLKMLRIKKYSDLESGTIM